MIDFDRIEYYFEISIYDPFYTGFTQTITDSLEKPFSGIIEELKSNAVKNVYLCIFLNIPGGNAETLENLVKITSHHFKEVYSNDLNLRPLILEYNDLICQYILRSGSEIFLHSRRFI